MRKILAFLFALLAAPASAQVIPSGPWGSINYWGVGGASQNLSPGTPGYCLTTQGTGSAPAWIACPGSALNLLPSINTNQFYGNVSGQFAPPVGVDVNTILNTVGYDIARPPTVESILYKSNVGPSFNWQALPPSPQGWILTSGGPTNPPFWSSSPTQSNLGSICTTVGALLYFDTPSQLWKCLNPGTSGQLLQTGGASGNPSWLTVTLATLGGVPSTRNINTTAPLGGGGTLASDLTLTCATCATTTNGGALAATSPVTLSAAGLIACATCATTTNGGALAATSPLSISAAGVISITSPLPVANGGTNAATQQAAFNNLAPTPTRAGDVTYWNGSNYVNLAGNNSGTNVLTENSSGVPSWTAPGTGTVTSITCFGTAITTSGTCTTAATKSDEQTGTSTTAVVTPSQQQQHDSAAKVWATWNGLSANCPGGTCTINAGYNASSVTRNSTGNYTVTFTTAFASANYACTTSNNQSTASYGTKTTTSIIVFTSNLSAVVDASDVSVVCFGRQ